jgi:hypothetical protein
VELQARELLFQLHAQPRLLLNNARRALSISRFFPICTKRGGARAAAMTTSLALRDAFFTHDSVQESVLRCIKSVSYHSSDPIVTFANVALRCPLSLTLTTTALCPFYDDVRIAIPYSSMTAAQLQVLESMVAQLEQANSLVNCTHMNGDFSVNAIRQGVRVHVDASLLLFAVSCLIERVTSAHEIDTDTVINVMQQRIACSVHLHRQQIDQARVLLLQHTAAAQATKSKATLTSECAVGVP